ncbi:phosphotransferase family protein [Aldersonia sp. NBC_00410]|uniref:phosphotransferase family protein n=1 Tax=Aldersonia sp. NBC_00410 TaxID=2975954 RepID=UPI00225670E4|nr:phosphotransferase family protein [Aldersonia sp. NBC_00410]MCX5044790.1 phosphotransferase family protein [Aldersonia sp. NBC_00410]
MTDTALAGLDLAALTSYFAANGVTVDGELRAELIAGGRSNLTFLVADDRSRWVLRRPPLAGLTPSAHDVVREFRVAAALQQTPVPVARTEVLCEDTSVMGAPFAVVEHVDGRVIRTARQLDTLTDAELESCVDELVHVLAALHGVDYRAVGLETFGKPSGFVGRQVKIWNGQWDRVKATEIPDVDRLGALLADRIPERDVTTIVHGDYRIDNTILSKTDAGRVEAVLDWEMSTLGDPLTDVALMCVYRNPSFSKVLNEDAAWSSERIPSADDLAQRYASATGSDLPHWDFYLGLANFKLAVIAAGIDHRLRAAQAEGTGAVTTDEVAAAVPLFAAAGLAALNG